MPIYHEMYWDFEEIGGIIPTHSTDTVAKAGIFIPALVTNPIACLYATIPYTRELSKKDVTVVCEANTGKMIVETIKKHGYNLLGISVIIGKNQICFLGYGCCRFSV